MWRDLSDLLLTSSLLGFENFMQGSSGWEYGRDVGQVLVVILPIFASSGTFPYSFSFLCGIYVFSQALLVLFDVLA